jgi:hypothetical protein
VLAALNLTISELFPERLPGHNYPRARAFTAMDALRALTREGTVVALVAADVAEGKPISAVDAQRACESVGRIATALEFVNGEH